MISRPEPDRIARSHRGAGVPGYELASLGMGQLCPLLRFYQPGVEDLLNRSPGPGRTAVARGTARDRVNIKLSRLCPVAGKTKSNA